MESHLNAESLRKLTSDIAVEVFATCPQSSQVPKEAYLKNVADVARWSEQYGCKGILVYTDNSLVDAWLVSQWIIENTNHLCPLAYRYHRAPRSGIRCSNSRRSASRRPRQTNSCWLRTCRRWRTPQRFDRNDGAGVSRTGSPRRATRESPEREPAAALASRYWLSAVG